MKTKNLLWILYIVFVALAVFSANDQSPFVSHGPYPIGKYIVWLLFIAFTVYTYLCSRKENLFRTIGIMNGLHWGRQIGIDLYIGLVLFMVLIYTHQQSVIVPLLWFLPVLAFANLATLLYVAVNYDSLIQLVL